MSNQSSITDLLNKIFDGASINIRGAVQSASSLSNTTVAVLATAIGVAVAGAIFATSAITPLPVTASLSIPNPLPVTWPSALPVTIPTPLPVTITTPLLVTTDVEALAHAAVTISATITTASVQVIAANANRKALSCYNNSANSVYLSMVSPANSSTSLFYILPTFAQVSLTQFYPGAIYTGAIYGIRNAGTGTVVCTELTL